MAKIMAGRHQRELAAKRASVKRMRDKWTPEQWETHHERARQQSRAKVARETPEKRAQRLAYYHQYGLDHPRNHHVRKGDG